MWTHLADDFTIPVVERPGYGFSEIVKGLPRDIGTMIHETREALRGAGKRPPFILVAHSMSTLEAIYWSNKYPGEIQAVIGIDPAVPKAYTYILAPSSIILRVVSFLASLGMIRFLPLADGLKKDQSDYLTEEQKKTYKELFHRRILTENMLDEQKAVRQNAETVDHLGIPSQTPMCFFISDGKEAGVDRWRDLLTDYLKDLDCGCFHDVQTGHYIHHHEPVFLADQIREFISSIQ